MPRFVILRHEPGPKSARGLHWDLMLEQEKSLLTWALDCEPAVGIEIPALRLPDHRIAYLEHHGPVSGERGEVSRFDNGTFRLLTPFAGDVDFAVEISGERLRGTVHFEQIDPPTHRWVVVFRGESCQVVR